MRYGSVCSGIEAASVAWHGLGWQPAWFAEIEPFPSAVLSHRFPEVANLGDMTKIARGVLTGEVEAPDVLVGGTPCQAFSVAGMREGLADARGQLTIKFVELADAIDLVRVRRGAESSVIVWENVPGVLSSKDNAFGCLLAALAGEDDALVPPGGGKWSNAGYVLGPARAIAWRVLDAQYFGVAQRRRRLFVVASASERVDPIRVLFEFQGGRGTVATDESRKGGRSCLAGGGALYRFRRTDSYAKDVTSSTLTARDYKDARDLVVMNDGRVRGLCAEEYEWLQGFPIGWTDISGATQGKRKKALGNSMAVPCMAWIGSRIKQEVRA